MKRLTICVWAVALLIPLLASANQLADASSPPSYKLPKGGVIPDQGTAVAITEAILKPVFDDRTIRGQEPFFASLVGDTWVVRGTLPKDALGYIIEVRLSKLDGRVITISPH